MSITGTVLVGQKYLSVCFLKPLRQKVTLVFPFVIAFFPFFISRQGLLSRLVNILELKNLFWSVNSRCIFSCFRRNIFFLILNLILKEFHVNKDPKRFTTAYLHKIKYYTDIMYVPTRVMYGQYGHLVFIFVFVCIGISISEFHITPMLMETN